MLDATEYLGLGLIYNAIWLVVAGGVLVYYSIKGTSDTENVALHVINILFTALWSGIVFATYTLGVYFGFEGRAWVFVSVTLAMLFLVSFKLVCKDNDGSDLFATTFCSIVSYTILYLFFNLTPLLFR